MARPRTAPPRTSTEHLMQQPSLRPRSSSACDTLSPSLTTHKRHRRPKPSSTSSSLNVRRMNAQKRVYSQHTKSKSVPATLSTKSAKSLKLGRSSSVGGSSLGARTTVKRRRPSTVSQARAPVVSAIVPTPARAAPPEISRASGRSVRSAAPDAIFDVLDQGEEYDVSFPTFDAALESDDDCESEEDMKLHGFAPSESAAFARHAQSPLSSLASPPSSFTRSSSDDSDISSPSAGPSRIWTSSPEPSTSACSTDADDSSSLLASPPQSFSFSTSSALDHLPAGQYKHVNAHQPVVERVAGACAVRVEHWTPLLAQGLRPPMMGMSVSDSWARPSGLRFSLQSPTPSHTPHGLPYPPSLGSPVSPRPGSPLSKSWSIQSASSTSASASNDEDQTQTHSRRPRILRKLSAEVFGGFGGKRPTMHGRGFSSPAVPRMGDLKESEAGGRPLSLLVSAQAPEERERRTSFLRRRLSSGAGKGEERRRSVFGLRLR
ncbi:hypothetical protein PENSPDRAFT_691983 [Peniophora sp. CONT]|nr:hypothetical protein PENSPDRAFT_691983 [Peniophora sp. CONT]